MSVKNTRGYLKPWIMHQAWNVQFSNVKGSVTINFASYYINACMCKKNPHSHTSIKSVAGRNST